MGLLYEMLWALCSAVNRKTTRKRMARGGTHTALATAKRNGEKRCARQRGVTACTPHVACTCRQHSVPALQAQDICTPTSQTRCGLRATLTRGTSALSAEVSWSSPHVLVLHGTYTIDIASHNAPTCPSLISTCYSSIRLARGRASCQLTKTCNDKITTSHNTQGARIRAVREVRGAEAPQRMLRKASYGTPCNFRDEQARANTQHVHFNCVRMNATPHGALYATLHCDPYGSSGLVRIADHLSDLNCTVVIHS